MSTDNEQKRWEIVKVRVRKLAKDERIKWSSWLDIEGAVNEQIRHLQEQDRKKQPKDNQDLRQSIRDAIGVKPKT